MSIDEEGTDYEALGYTIIDDTVKCYAKGKTLQCPCGQGIGVKYEVATVRCASCGKELVDTKTDDREPPKRDEGQSGLEQWT